MSDSTGLIVISFLGVLGFFLTLRIGKMANDVGAQIVTGVVDGTSVSSGVRQGMLFQIWLPYEVTGVASHVFLAAAELELATQVSAPSIKLIAHFAAFLAGVGALMFLLVGVAGLFQYRALIRKAKAK